VEYWTARGRVPDATHKEQLQIAIENVKWAMGQVEKYCKCDKDIALAAAELAAAGALIARALPFL